jgi:hypothetical protein
MRTPENNDWWVEGGECDKCKWSNTRVKEICEDCQRQKKIDNDLDRRKQEKLDKWLND